MSQVAAFFTPSVLPIAAGPVATAASTAAPIEGFAAVLAQLQATFSAPNVTPTTVAPSDASEASGLAVFGITPKSPANATEPKPHLLDSAALVPQGETTLFPQGETSLFAQTQFVAPTPIDNAALVQVPATPSLELPVEISSAGDQTPFNPSAARTQLPQVGTNTVAQLQLRGAFSEQSSVTPAVEERQSPPAKVAEAATTLVAKPSAAQAPAITRPLASPKRAPDDPGQLKTEATPSAKPSDSAPAPAQQPQAAAAQINPAAPQARPSAADAPTTPQPQTIAAAPPPVLPSIIEAQQMATVVVAAPQAGIPLDALAVHIARKFEAGANQFEIRLHPAELGQLDISLTVADDGHVHAVLRVERPETLDLLQRDARSLEQQLRQAGLEVGSNALSFSLSGGNGQRHAPFTGWPAFAEAQTNPPADEAVVAAKYLAVRMRDGIDIRV